MSPRLLLLIAALLFSTGGAAIKFTSLEALEVACFRSIVAASTLWIVLPGVRRRWTWGLFAVGCAYAAMLILFVSATKLTTAANAIFLQSTAPVYLLFIGPMLLKEPLRKSDFALMLAMATGMSFFFISTEPAVETAPNPWLGNLLGAASGLAWAFVVAGLRWISKGDATGSAGIATVFAGNAIAFCLTLFFALPLRDFQLPDILTILYLGTCQISLAYFCMARAVRKIPAFETAAILLVEPALNPVWTWIVMAEQPGTLAIIGGGILLVATCWNAWWQHRQSAVLAIGEKNAGR